MSRDLVQETAQELPTSNKRGLMGFVPKPFDYGQLAVDLAETARDSAARICASKREHVIAVGQELIKMKEKLAHGQFTEWVDLALNFAPTTARNYMRAAKEFADKPATVAALPPATLYRLAGAPNEVRQQIARKIEKEGFADRDEVDAAIQKGRAAAAEARRIAKLAPEERAKQERKADARQRRLQRYRDEEDAQKHKDRMEHLRAASELMAALETRFNRGEIARLNYLWSEAGPDAVEQIMRSRGAAQ